MMYEYHGWCAILDPIDDLDTFKREEAAVETIRAFIATFDWANDFCEVRVLNGKYFVHFGGYHNPPRDTHGQIEALLELIAQQAAGSYGLVYWIDDEDSSPPGRLGWRVKVLRRGMVEERFDPFLSPIIPMVEDP